jgi:hypothetical protein
LNVRKQLRFINVDEEMEELPSIYTESIDYDGWSVFDSLDSEEQAWEYELGII